MAKRLYECMFLLDSGRFASDPQGSENALRELLSRCKAEIVAMAPWQDGKLAYQIKTHRKGLHYLTYFRMDGGQVDELTRLCKLNEFIVRHLLINHESPGLFDQMVQVLAAHMRGDVAPAPAAAASE